MSSFVKEILFFFNIATLLKDVKSKDFLLNKGFEIKKGKILSIISL